MKNVNCLLLYFKTDFNNQNDNFLCNNCYIFISFLKYFDKKHIESTNLQTFKNIIKKINNTKTYNNMYEITLYLYNKDNIFQKNLNDKINIICKNKKYIKLCISENENIYPNSIKLCYTTTESI